MIAVATGIYSYEQLKAEQPEMLLDLFAELLDGPGEGLADPQALTIFFKLPGSVF